MPIILIRRAANHQSLEIDLHSDLNLRIWQLLPGDNPSGHPSFRADRWNDLTNDFDNGPIGIN
jgi:hypothetical protein